MDFSIAILIFGFGIGVLVGMTGMGGGALMTPLLILIFGVSPTTAIGTDILYAAITKTVGGWRHFKMKTVNMGLVFWLAVLGYGGWFTWTTLIPMARSYIAKPQAEAPQAQHPQQ